MKKLLILCLILVSCWALPSKAQSSSDMLTTSEGPLTVHPIHHATFTMSWNGETIYVDPTGGAKAFAGMKAPDLILITHAHGDHFSPETLQALDTKNAIVVVPQSVADKMPEKYGKERVILANGESADNIGISIKAVPMYNLPPSKDAYHPKGWGNGYVLIIGGKRIYISGDTEGTPEMRALKNIDLAFVCMNLPYTMDVEHAAAAVLAFKPKIVYPYHYRGQDTKKFKELVNSKDPNIEVRLRDWYK